MYAIAWYDDAEPAALFRDHGATIDDLSAGDTPFLAAYNWKRLQVAEWFLKNGANVNAMDTNGNTALFYAVKRKHRLKIFNYCCNTERILTRRTKKAFRQKSSRS